jgi:hypothetical protein
LEQSREAWRKERADRGDTAGSAHDRSAAEFDRAYGAVEGLLRAEAEREFTANLDFIRRELKAEILGATSGEEARTAHELRHDAQVSEALRYLGDNRLYAAALRADVKSAKAK